MKQEEKGNKNIGGKIIHALGIILCIILIPILVVNLTLITKSVMYPDKVPDFFGYKPFIVLSASMEPTIMTGDLVIVKEISDVNSLQVNDVISFRDKKDQVITHRITAIDNSEGLEFVTKGDNNNTEDSSKVKADSLEGKYLARIPMLGSFAMFLQEPIGLLIFVVTPIAIFIIWDMFSRNSKSKKDSKREEELQAEIDRLRKLAEEKTDKEKAEEKEVEEEKKEEKKEILEEVEEKVDENTAKEGDAGASEDTEVIDSEDDETESTEEESQEEETDETIQQEVEEEKKDKETND